jgi:hypothetical protein
MCITGKYPCIANYPRGNPICTVFWAVGKKERCGKVSRPFCEPYVYYKTGVLPEYIPGVYVVRYLRSTPIYGS